MKLDGTVTKMKRNLLHIVLLGLVLLAITFNHEGCVRITVGKATRVDPKAQELYERASEASNRNRHDEALSMLNKALAISPEFTRAYYFRAVIHETLADQARTSQPNSVQASQYYQKAALDHEKTVTLEPRHTFYLDGLSMIYVKLGEYGKAEIVAKRAFAINPHDGLARDLLDQAEAGKQKP